MVKYLAIQVMCLLLSSLPMHAQDSLLTVLQDELKYDMTQLQQQETKPYFISLRVEDTRQHSLSSSFGVTGKGMHNHVRLLAPQIRVGSPELDNFKYNTQGAVASQDARQQANPMVLLPMNNDATTAIRQVIWAELTKRYDYAVQVLQQNKVKAQTQVADEDKAPCFSTAPAETYYEAPLPAQAMMLDEAAWQQRLNQITAVFRKEPLLKTGEASLTFDVVRTYMVNTEGSAIVQNRRTARVMLSASMQADDGMQLPLYADFFAFSPDSLPATDVMVAKAEEMITRLRALREAPVADPYTGPAILSGEASGVFFHEIFGHRLEGHRLKKGGQTFKKMVGERVLPETFQVFSDPTLKHYAGTDMNGCYQYDDEGVRARRVDNVVNGVLKSFLMSRVPLDGFPQSNGHGRAQGGNDPVSRQSNLVVQTTKPYTDDQLRAMLKAEAKKQGKEYGYFFKTVTSGYTLTGENGSLNSFNVTPLEVYRVFVDGRKDQLVRGVDLIGTPLAMFSNIAAAGDTPKVFTGSCGAESGWVPVTASSPMIFAKKIETQRREQQRTLPPVLSAPSLDAMNISQNPDQVILDAMHDEMQRSMDSLALPGEARPCYIAYTTSRWRDFLVTATLGGTVTKQLQPWQMDGTVQVIAGDRMNSSEVSEGTCASVALPAEPDYGLIRRDFWGGTDYYYQYALQNKAQKDAYLASKPKSAELAAVPDILQLPAGEVTVRRDKPYQLDIDRLEQMARELSKEFSKYPALFGTKVTISGNDMDIYRVNSDGLRMKQPKGSITLTAYAKARTDDGEVVADVVSIEEPTPDDLPSMDVLRQKVNDLAEKVLAERDAPKLLTSYDGPVLFQGEGICLPFAMSLLSPGNGVVQKDFFGINKPGLEEKLGEEVIDKKLTVKNLPTLKTFEGQALAGSYDYDIDGQQAQDVTIVENGIFRQALCGRYPMPKSPASTASTAIDYGNPQAMATFTAPGVISVEVEKGTPEEQMKKQLIKAAKSQQQKHAYIVRYMDGASSLLVYSVDVKTGAELLMRAGEINPLSVTNLKTVKAVSADRHVTNNKYKGSNISVIAPESLLLEKFTIPRAQSRAEKLPAITNPTER